MLSRRADDHARAKTALSRGEFLELVQQPYAQPTIAPLLDEWFGYCISGAHETAEIRSVTGEPVDLNVLFGTIEAHPARRAALHEAVLRLRK